MLGPYISWLTLFTASSSSELSFSRPLRVHFRLQGPRCINSDFSDIYNETTEYRGGLRPQKPSWRDGNRVGYSASLYKCRKSQSLSSNTLNAAPTDGQRCLGSQNRPCPPVVHENVCPVGIQIKTRVGMVGFGPFAFTLPIRPVKTGT